MRPLASRSALAADAALSLVINPRTGDRQHSQRHDNEPSTSTAICSHPARRVFNPAGWTKLHRQRQLSRLGTGAGRGRTVSAKANLFSSLGLSGGTSFNLGSPYLPVTPTADRPVRAIVRIRIPRRGGGSVDWRCGLRTAKQRCAADQPATGAASLQNQSLFNVNIDGLLITSPASVLDPVGWQGLAESGTAGWTAGAAAKQIDWAKAICSVRRSCRQVELRFRSATPDQRALDR